MTISKNYRFFLIPLILIAVIGIGITAAVQFREKWQDDHIDANTVFFEALADINSWRSYRYTLSSELTLNNGAKTKTVLRGEQDSNGNLHIFGKIMDTEMEAYQFGTDHYRFQSSSKQWKLLTDSPLTDNGVLRMVLEPKLNFTFADTISVDYQGTVKEKNEKYYRFAVIPKEGFHIADTYFTDFVYRVDILAETGQIQNARITAVTRTQSENQLTCALRFFDINEDFTLKPPEGK